MILTQRGDGPGHPPLRGRADPVPGAPSRVRAPSMRTGPNFADPEYEPTDEELAELMQEAFSGIRDAREQSLQEMRARIAAAQELARARIGDLRKRATGGS